MKRGKIIISLAVCLLSLGMLVFGVYSTVKVEFGFGGVLSFNPEGVFVDIEGHVYRGSEYDNLTAVSGDEFSFYGKNYDDSTGVTSGNFAIDEWKPSIAFLPAQKFIRYEVSITNQSSEPISVIPSGFTNTSNIEGWEKVSEVLRIDPSATGTYVLNLEYTGSESTQNTTFDITFDIQTTSTLADAQTGVSINQTNTQITSVTGTNTANPDLLIIPKASDSQITTEIANGTYSSPVFNNITAKYIIFEANVISLGAYAFYNCTTIESVSLPYLETTSISAFENCDSLLELTLPSLINLGLQTFRYCNQLIEIEMEQVEIIGSFAFYSCNLLQSLDCPRLNQLGTSGVSNCSSLVKLSFPKLQVIPDSGIGGLTALKELDISSVVTISQYGIRGCTSLEVLVLPATLESVGDWGIIEFTNLKTIICYATTPPNLSSDGKFLDCDNLTRIYVPAESVSAYKSNSDWSSFSNMIYSI